MDIENLNINKLRRDLIDYYMAAIFIVSPAALIDMTKVENASDEEIITTAQKAGFNLQNYRINHYFK